MTTMLLGHECPPQVAVSANDTTPNPGIAGVNVWSTTEGRTLYWDGSKWVPGDLYQLSIALRAMLAFRDTGGVSYAAQPAEFSVRKRVYKARSGVSVPQLDAFSNNLVGGSAVARAIGASTFLDGVSRIGHVTDAAAGSGTGWYDNDERVVPVIGVTPAAGGFFFAARLALPVVNAGSRFFIGLQAQAGAPPSALLNPFAGSGRGSWGSGIGFGWADADTALLQYLNLSTATVAPQTALPGGGFLKTDTAKLLEVAIYQPRGEPVVGLAYRKLDGTAQNWTSWAVTLGQIAPATLRPLIWLSNGANAIATAVDIASVYLESEY